MRKIIIILSLIFTTTLISSCEPYEPCWQCAQNYDENGNYIGETCWEVRCCEIYYPYDCGPGDW